MNIKYIGMTAAAALIMMSWGYKVGLCKPNAIEFILNC